MYILASQSVRREELLKQLNIDFLTVPSFFDEEQVTYEAIDTYVETLAFEKANAVFKKYPNDIIIGADTVILFNNRVLGKPVDENDAFNMLQLLSGQTHEVYTGISVISKSTIKRTHDIARVTFKSLDDETIRAYVKTKEPFDKSGSYAIQGFARAFIEQFEGDIETIIGLPTNVLKTLLKDVAL
jgi:septum formation protein